ncbi:hypothetical protein ACIRRA_13520 [Nocardia sp. NPDC101769]
MMRAIWFSVTATAVVWTLFTAFGLLALAVVIGGTAGLLLRRRGVLR